MAKKHAAPYIDPRKVFVVHGRNDASRTALFTFLRAIGLHPLEWSEIVRATGKASPYIGEVLEKGFSIAQAVVVLMTPDDEARLREQYRGSVEPACEIYLTSQPRPNVLLEGGMALGLFPDRTVIVELGHLRPISDIGGRHVIRINDTVERRHELAQRLQTAGCEVNMTGTDWYKAGSFSTHCREACLFSGDVFTNSLGMNFVWIPPGSFMMGSAKEEVCRADNESQHKVTLSRGFYMGIHPVTQEHWGAVMGNRWLSTERNVPVEMVSWEDCQEFIKKLRERDKKPYRLPTEAEWEFSCRAGTITPFYFGETISTDQVNHDGNQTYGTGKKGLYRKKTTPVGDFPANSWGLFDMHGNLWEWCQDWFAYYQQGEVVDPQGPDSGKGRVLRGGSWFDNPWNCRSACRNWKEPDTRNLTCGFRLAYYLE